MSRPASDVAEVLDASCGAMSAPSEDPSGSSLDPIRRQYLDYAPSDDL